jgi:hypothetical protein
LQRAAENAIEGKQRSAYQQAAEYLRDAHRLALRCDAADDFDTYVRHLRTTHSAKLGAARRTRPRRSSTLMRRISTCPAGQVSSCLVRIRGSDADRPGYETGVRTSGHPGGAL